MKTRIKYYWLCTYTTAATGEKTVFVANEKTNTPKYFTSPERAREFLRRSGLADAAHLGWCRCELKAVEV